MTSQPTPSLLSRYRQLSPSAAIFVSPMCLGTMNFGDKYASMMGECSKQTTFDILDHYFEQGGNYVDTANSYHDGQTEMWLGEWMTSRGNRDQVVLATKYTGPHRRTAQGIKVRVNYGGNGMKALRLTLKDSLKRLQTEYVDILWLHWWNYTATIPEVMHGLNDPSSRLARFFISAFPTHQRGWWPRPTSMRETTACVHLWSIRVPGTRRYVTSSEKLCPCVATRGWVFALTRP